MRFFRRFIALFQRHRFESEMEEEMRLHREHRVEQAIESGMSRRDAERVANRQMGALDVARESARDGQGFVWFEQLKQDVGYALRNLRKSRGFAFAIITTLAIGIGGNTACFSLINSLFLRPLAYPNADRVVLLSESPPGNINYSSDGSSFVRWSENRDIFDRLGGWHSRKATLTGRDQRVALNVAEITTELFDIFGMSIAHGRGFLPGEYKSGGNPVIVVSHELWQWKLKSDLNQIGEQLLIDEITYEIVGILQPKAFPYGDMVFTPSDVRSNEFKRASESDYRMSTFGLLSEGVDAARVRLNAIRDVQAENFPVEKRDWRDNVQTWRNASYGSHQTSFILGCV